MRTRQSAGISLLALTPVGSPPAPWLRIAGPVLDRLLGIRALDSLYRQHRLQSLPPLEFASRTLEILGISVSTTPADWSEYVPARGPLLIVCNHPFGGVEALALARELKAIRTDIKFLANAALKVFSELHPLFIATNPLKTSHANQASIRHCQTHLRDGGVLVLFPAGRVSFQQHHKARIADGQWHRMVGHLAKTTGATLLPVFFHGANSRLFHVMGRVWDRSKLLMLPREFLKLRGRRIRFNVGRPLPPPLWQHMNAPELTAYARVMTYLAQDMDCGETPANDAGTPAAELAPYGDRTAICNELDTLPARQKLLDFKQFSVFYAMSAQIPTLMRDIARERERVFRLYDEGSGQARDTDGYDRSYVQLFVWDRDTQSLVGAYRMGRTDLLKQQYGPAGNYLAQMFDFDMDFHDPAAAALELGRSFVIPEHQKSFYALYLLWQGIGHYLVAHPQYRRLYGTVSLSRLYDYRAVLSLCDALIEPSPHVRPKHRMLNTPHPEWRDYQAIKGRPDLKTLSAIVRGLDAGGRDIPVLLKHYHKIGAKFHCVGVDPNFNNTPGLLLSVDIASMTPKLVSTFLGKDAGAYLAYGAVHDNRGRPG
ncbi:MAG: GNAT family N-acyltransferase [Thiogranum sp.]|nr:GNAT family N-acyltransferase [Thiogranum sp.]